MRRRRSPPFPISFRPIAKGADEGPGRAPPRIERRGEIIGEIAERLQRIARLLGVDEEPTAATPANMATGTPKVAKA